MARSAACIEISTRLAAAGRLDITWALQMVDETQQWRLVIKLRDQGPIFCYAEPGDIDGLVLKMMVFL